MYSLPMYGLSRLNSQIEGIGNREEIYTNFFQSSANRRSENKSLLIEGRYICIVYLCIDCHASTLDSQVNGTGKQEEGNREEIYSEFFQSSTNRTSENKLLLIEARYICIVTCVLIVKSRLSTLKWKAHAIEKREIEKRLHRHTRKERKKQGKR